MKAQVVQLMIHVALLALCLVVRHDLVVVFSMVVMAGVISVVSLSSTHRASGAAALLMRATSFVIFIVVSTWSLFVIL